MYCGNNANNPSLLNGTKVLGTRYSCLQKGRSFGYAQPVDPNFLGPYQPIDTTKKYCGNASILPDEYDRFGNIYECFLKGVGVGKKIKADNHVNPPPPPPPPPQFSFGKSTSNNKDNMNKDKDNMNNDKDNMNKDKDNMNNDKDNMNKDKDNMNNDKDNMNKDKDNMNNKKKYLLTILTIFLIIFNFSLLYYIKPNIILIKNDDIKDINKEKKINWFRFICLYLFICLISYFILFYIVFIV
jgi:hypothetical protein